MTKAKTKTRFRKLKTLYRGKPGIRNLNEILQIRIVQGSREPFNKNAV